MDSYFKNKHILSVNEVYRDGRGWNDDKEYFGRDSLLLFTPRIIREDEGISIVNIKYLNTNKENEGRTTTATVGQADISRNDYLELVKENTRELVTPVKEMFYTESDNDFIKNSCIGHLRIDFDSSGEGFHHTYFPCGDSSQHTGTERLLESMTALVNSLRNNNGVLHNRNDMCQYMGKTPADVELGVHTSGYMFVDNEADAVYALRCKPSKGDYDAYLYVYDAEQLKKGQLQEIIFDWVKTQHRSEPTQAKGNIEIGDR